MKTKPRMNQNVKKMWVKALRSGKFNQCVGGYKDGNKCCVIGVLDRLCARSKHKKLSACAHKTFQWAGLEDEDGNNLTNSRNEDVIIRLIRMNDAGATFNQLAAYIERYL